MDLIFNGKLKSFSELLDETLAEIKQDGGFIECVRRQKVCLIEDIFKAGKCLNGYCAHYSDYLNPTPFMFDCLYDKDLEELELVLAELSATLSANVRSFMEGKNV